MTRTGSMFRKRWPALVTVAVLLAVGLAAGTLLTPNQQDQPVPEAAAEQVQPDLTDPGLYAEPGPPSAVMPEPAAPAGPETAISEPTKPDRDPGAGQVIPQESSALKAWLADQPEELGPFTTQDAMAATQLDVDWVLYQAMEKGLMTQDEADAFQTWYDQRPSVAEAPELLDNLPAYPDLPGIENYAEGKSELIQAH